ncbi:F-box/kelch-repeat protein At5g42350-like [Nymphaea colorata]|uniref:F-box domain-containing protein n=1 Tax=Nymphaea colorata TaxID=210225 RepID=A0A5K1AGL6_9MAGN|nr:F-box/kelch-repeat protein At5g42350-like [Nymphaea colorata]
MVILGGLDGPTDKKKFFWQEAGEASPSGVPQAETPRAQQAGSPRAALFRWALRKMQPELGAAGVPSRLMRGVSRRMRKIGQGGEGDEEGKDEGLSLGCLGFHVKTGGCRVGADMIDECQLGRRDGLADGSIRRISNGGDETTFASPGCASAQTGNGSPERERISIDCFASGMAEMFRKRTSRKEMDACRLSDYKEKKDLPSSNTVELSLPDDILEMCLARVPFATVMNARMVCKRWRLLTSTPHFMQMRCDYSYQSPWLFLFGGMKDGYCAGEIQALDVSLGSWHKIDARILRGRFLFSVASVGTSIYVIGGCSGLNMSGKVEKTTFKTHKGVLVFNPFTGLWRKAAPMNTARSAPVVGVLEVASGCSVLHGSLFSDGLQVEQQREGNNRLTKVRGIATVSRMRRAKSHLGAVSDVYGDPHRFSQRRQLRHLFSEIETLPEDIKACGSSCAECSTSESVEEQNNYSGTKDRRFLLIVVGGQGSWDQPLNSAEVYDPASNKWADIKSLPADFGAVRSGAVCNGKFYVYSESDKLASYDIEMRVWFIIQTPNFPPRLLEYFPKLVSCDGRLFILCVSWSERDGRFGRQDRAVRKLWELDLTLHVWTEISRHPDAPMDWNAAFVAHGDKIYGIEMFKVFGQVLNFLTVCCTSDSVVKWSHISRKHVKIDLDASSCLTKSMVMLNL